MSELTTEPAESSRSLLSGDTAERPGAHLPGDVHMWVFVLGDLIIFSAYFVIFMVYRTQHENVFLESQQNLSQNIGVLNTLVLLASSWFAARSVHAVRAEDHRRAGRLLVATGSCGLIFALVKACEWATELRQGLTLTTNDFFMFYYMLTGVHLVHVVIGLIILGVAYRELRHPKTRTASMVEQGTTFWHMVDLLWIVIFAMVYVMR